ncbi:MAG TPA: alpha-2,8-polysialyltransferase family protein [Thermomonospora sp.]|nr:alpha-2,8-polysialyltransferase family protein [Thermomonospora sp.]
MTQIFVSSRLYGAMCLAAGIDAGHFGPPGRRRILLVSHDSPLPELTDPPHRRPGYAPLLSRFDEVILLNEVIAPHHPQSWHPGPSDQPVFERLLRTVWGLGDGPLELVVEAIQSNPARALAAIFQDAAITIYSDGLAAYGATRATPPPGVGSRVTRLLHLDLVPGLTPQLLAEYGARAERLPGEAFLAVLEEVCAEIEPLFTRHGPLGDDTALIVGQYFSELEILTAEEEDRLHLQMLRGVVARGHRTVLFKPHPHSPPRLFRALEAEAGRLGARLVVIDDPVPAEAWFARARPALVVGICSTAMMTAQRLFGIPAATMGVRYLLKQLQPYANSNRIPATIVDAMLPRLTPAGELHDPMVGPGEVATRLVPLVAAVAYCMQPSRRGDLRQAAIEYLSGFDFDSLPRRYFRPQLAVLGLPGAGPLPGDPGEEAQTVMHRIKRLLPARQR